jgi:uncharacterized repeat protein (TIGR01451 family)
MYDGSSWTSQKIDTTGIESVSCVSPTFCVAGDHNGNVLMFNGSTWSAPEPIDPIGGTIWSVSCASATFCAAGDDSGNVLVFNGSSWSAPYTLDPALPGLVNREGTVRGVSCPTPVFCVAVDQNGKAYKYNGSSWTAPFVVDANAYFFGVSCVSPSFCIAADFNFGTVYTYNGSWSGPNHIDKVIAPSLLAISCASATFCVALDGNYGHALTYDGSSWSATTIDTMDPFGLGAVSCPTPTFCAAVDSLGNALIYSDGFTLGKLVDKPMISPGSQLLTYSLAVVSTNPSGATGVTVSDTLPAGASLVTWTSTQGSCAGAQPVVCSIGSLPAGTKAQITITVSANWTPGRVTNTATATSNEYPAATSNTVTTIVRSASDLSIMKTASPAAVNTPGDMLVYTLSVQNNGPFDVLDVEVTDNLPLLAVVQPINPTQGGCYGKQAISCDLGTMANGSSASIMISVIPQAGSTPLLSNSIINTASVTSPFNDDPIAVNNTASVAVSCPYCTTQATTSLTLTSSLNPSAQGQSVTFSAKLTTNAAATPNSSVDFLLDGSLPPLATVPLGLSGSASYSTATLTAGTHTITVRYAGDQYYKPTSASLTQTVTASTGGGGGGVGSGTCACSKSGLYVDPASGVIAGLDPLSSPSNKYTVQAIIDNVNQQTTLSVLQGSTPVFSPGSLPITTHWTFSPDDDRFAYHFLDPNSNVDEVYVYDLGVSPARKVVHNSIAQSGVRLQFSPSGKYFLYMTLLGVSTTEFFMYRVQGVGTQTLVYDSAAINFAVGHGQDDFGELNWGFSPDKPETSFVYAYVDGQSNVQWNVVNLAVGRNVKNVSLTTIASFWQFDPCGDVIALVSQPSANQAQVDLYSASSGAALASQVIPSLSPTLLANAGLQEVQFNGQTTVLATDPGCGPNTPVGNQVVVQPRDASSGTSPVTVTFPAVTQAGQTTLTDSSIGAAPPADFELGSPATYYDLTTTAVFTPAATVCFNYAGIMYNNPSSIRLYHYENGSWVDRTISHDTSKLIVCGNVNSFSPFALFEPADTAPPVTVATLSSRPNAAGWSNTNVTITLNSADNEPGGLGVKQITYSAGGAQSIASTTVNTASVAIPISTEGITTLSFFATDNAGNAESAKTLTVRVDKTPPSINCGPADGQWHATDVTISCLASDSVSGLANSTDASFSLSTSVPSGTETSNAATGTHSVCDVAGNCATTGPIAGNMVDKKPPTISISSPTAGTSYLLNQAVNASYKCTDGGSGVATCAGTVANNSAIDTASVGSKTFTVNAADKVGNVAAPQSISYSGTYGLCILYDPTRAVQSGSTIPLKIQLCDANNGDVSSSTILVHATSLVQAGTSASEVLQASGNANPDNDFRFDSTLGPTGGYIFNLSTKGLTTGSYLLTFTASADPNPHVLSLQVR